MPEILDWTQTLPYVTFYMASCLSHKAQPTDFREFLLARTELLNSKNSLQVMIGAGTGNVKDMIDMIIRSYTGCGALKNEEFATELLAKMIAPNNPMRLSRSNLGRAYGIISYILYEERFAQGPQAMNIDCVYRGAVYADKAAAVGFVPPVVLTIAQTIETNGFRHPERCPAGYTVDRFLALKDLWRVYDERTTLLERQYQARDDKVRENGNLYFCAASGCGIEGTHKSGLARCNGKCPPEGKPSYCSKECQKKDWPRHKAFCKPDGPLDDVVTAIREGNFLVSVDPSTAEASRVEHSGSLPLPRSAEEIRSETHQRRVNVTLPDGQNVAFASSTMSPEMMREVQQMFQGPR